MTFTWRRLYTPGVVWGVLSTTQRVLVISNSSAPQRLPGRAICLCPTRGPCGVSVIVSLLNYFLTLCLLASLGEKKGAGQGGPPCSQASATGAPANWVS